VSHPLSLATALFAAAYLSKFCRQVQAVSAQAEAVMTLTTEHGFPQWLAGGTILRGWVLVAQGQTEAGIAQLRHGLAAWRATGAEILRPYVLGLLAEAYGKSGQAAEGLTVLEEALALVEKTGQGVYEAELHRLHGELLLIHAVGGGGAEACFQQALTVARRQQAKSLELRAAMSLSRLWQCQGKRDAAQQVLSEVYGWFTEGFDTADLQEAKALLEALG